MFTGFTNLISNLYFDEFSHKSFARYAMADNMRFFWVKELLIITEISNIIIY